MASSSAGNNSQIPRVHHFDLMASSMSWERTIDCYSPGQGLMPASFKVRTVPLDGNEAFEKVLDPDDFGESAIGRVAPVDSGMLNFTVEAQTLWFCYMECCGTIIRL
ncbi:hypothetical protein K1719_006080 [Acacia pycnantha]|nr:hypothetical protein K1719_006080 [Acacia pycnantha]